MMKVLLSYNVKVHDALLHAINEECVDAFEILLKHNNELKMKRRGALKSMGDVVQQILQQVQVFNFVVCHVCLFILLLYYLFLSYLTECMAIG